MKHYSYPEIPQFRTLLSNLRHSYRYIGQGPDNKPMYNENAPLPKVLLTGSVKAHGGNGSVVLTRAGEFYAQSKENILDEELNFIGFYQYVMANEVLLRSLLSRYLQNSADDVEAVVLYGEWCGPGIQKKVGIAKLELPIFVVFDLRLIDSTYEKGNTGFIESPLLDFTHIHARMYSVHLFKRWQIELDLADPEAIQQRLIEETIAVEIQCPIAAHFGVVGAGEGIVWTIFHKGRKYRMKVKGEKHSGTKVKTLASPNVEKINSISEFIEYAFTQNRFEQGIGIMQTQNIELNASNINFFVKWVFGDVKKEESDTLVKNGLTSKDISFKGNYAIRQWYMNRIS